MASKGGAVLIQRNEHRSIHCSLKWVHVCVIQVMTWKGMVSLYHLSVSLHLSLPDRRVFVQVSFKFTSHSRPHQNTQDAVKTQSWIEGEVAYIHTGDRHCTVAYDRTEWLWVIVRCTIGWFLPWKPITEKQMFHEFKWKHMLLDTCCWLWKSLTSKKSSHTALGDLGGPQKSSCCQSSGWKRLHNQREQFEISGPPTKINARAGCVCKVTEELRLTSISS